MDQQFPQQLFPSFYNSGPPDSLPEHCAGNWGCYDRVRAEGGSGAVSNWTFTPGHQVRGETWRHTEPVPVPLLQPKRTFLSHSKPPDPQDFREHMQNFFMDHCQDAFGCMGEILSENFNFEKRKSETNQNSVNMWMVKNVLASLDFKICHKTYRSRPLSGFGALLSDAVHSVPPELLGSLLYEELTEQRQRMVFFEGATGGALTFIPFSEGSSSQRGCLLYPGNQGLNQLNFHNVELQHHRGRSSVLTTGGDPFRFHLKGPIRQISSASLFNNCCVAVRSDHLCGVWRFSEGNDPRLLQVVNTAEVATCVSASPHVLGEVLVASESGAANLWTVGKGMLKVREEETNLYFNAKSSWRWCEFSAHPRVMLYADRTGVELTDIRSSPASGHTLFRISNTSECRSGERLILSRYLGDAHSFHHLITTQYSAYVMDERFPGVPMLKWDHMMESPPLFCHVLPGSASSGSVVGGDRTTKVVLGSYSSQEITMLQYSGGRVEACFSRGPPQALHRPRESLKLLPVQIPHRLDTATNRLSSPAAGLTCVQKKGGEECICVVQLTEAGDLFYQILEPDRPDADTSRPPAAETLPREKEAPTPERKPAEHLSQDSQLVVADTSSDEEVIGPTQAVPRFVAETPEREQLSDSEDSQMGEKGRLLKQLGLTVIVNDDPEPDEDPEPRPVGELDRGETDAAGAGKEPSGAEEPLCSPSSSSPVVPPEKTTDVKLSKDVLVTWKRWLQKLMKKSCGKRPRPHLLHFTNSTDRLLHLPVDGEARDPSEEERVQSLRRDLRTCMSKRSLLLHETVSASLAAPDSVPLPNVVDTEAWKDELSQRLTLSWQGEDVWRAWWEDKLGLNKEEKVKALRRKRRREKAVKRASGQRLELSGSFCSSISYQDLGGFSDSGGWSSAASQGAWSDSEGMMPMSQSECGTPRATTPSTTCETPVPTPTTTPAKDKQGDQRTPSSSCIRSLSQKPEATSASLRRSRHLSEDALFTPQVRNVLKEESGVRSPRRTPRVDPSREDFVWSGFSQSLSQGSQTRPGPSQSSQASQKKKKSRMGF
ncbi:TATA box-binding protein-associated factor RNA polymerase I subunit C isoform X1 [Hippoglossus hippoglossus]|uniref:TATA box-binding protein-associated factor RNA polymerase I subunit C isoform X1 n=2 Tax=Hippoglossus hippoglossus TaxID=8267 RepID=UPI00148E7AD5|nr:TATA box-binding protein-associated factor RNA polymerase I subunit C isoform X1 [Hippoglossus hippoglossus]